jgi:hypothetical protein
MPSPEIKRFIREHQDDDVRHLALQADSFSLLKINFPFLLNQIAGRQLIRNRISSWYPLEDVSALMFRAMLL